MKLTKTTTALWLLLMASPALAETATVPAEQLFPYLANYYSLPPASRNHFELGYYLNVKGDRNTVSAILKGASGDVPLQIAADGRLSPLPSAADLAAKRQIALSAPKGTSVGMALKIRPSTPPSANLDAAYLAVAVTQAHDGAKKAAGLLGVMVPNLQTVCFDGAHQGSAVLASGKTAALPVLARPGTPVKAPCFTPSDMPGAIRITLDQTPVAMFIGPRPK